MTLSLTYTTLRTEIADWTENDATEFLDKRDTIIGLAELRLHRDLDLGVFRKYATASMTIGDRFLAKPTDFVIDRALNITVGTAKQEVLRRDTSFIQDYHPDPAVTGVPRYYAEHDEAQFIIAPTPDVAYVTELAYTRRQTGLSSSNATSWLSDNAADVLLYACLIESTRFMKASETPNLDMWKEAYQEGISKILLEEMARQRRTEYRTGKPR